MAGAGTGGQMRGSATGTVAAMNGPDEPPARIPTARGTGQLLLSVSLGLVVAAAAALALGADDPRLLRLGVLAALGAALLGALAVGRMRREVTSAAGHAEDLRGIHRLEVEREISARREHELTMQREMRREAREDSRDELEAVRAELRLLRENLQQLLGGELLVERVAVRAESTRVRSLPEEAPPLSPPRLRALEQLEQAVDLVVPHAGTDDSGQEPDPETSRPETQSTPRMVPSLDQPPAGSAAPGPQQHPDRSEPTESPPLPRRDPEVRADPTRRPRPEAEAPWSAPRSAGFTEGSLFEKVSQRSNSSWTQSWPSAPGPWDPTAQVDSQPTTLAESCGDRSEPDPPTVPMALGRQHGRDDPDVPTGAHSGGRSVDDLLAAYGADVGVRHRRRREDD